MSTITAARLSEINAKEDLTLRLGDALDVKASICLAIILFLATQSAYFFDKGLSSCEFWIQVVSIICIIAGAICAIVELWPREYTLPHPESDIVSSRIDELTRHYSAYPNAAAAVEDALIADEIGWAKSRIAETQKKNWTKSNFLNWSFWLTAGAVVLNLLTLLIRIK
jgi:hypothetical protein